MNHSFHSLYSFTFDTLSVTLRSPLSARTIHQQRDSLEFTQGKTPRELAKTELVELRLRDLDENTHKDMDRGHETFDK